MRVISTEVVTRYEDFLIDGVLGKDWMSDLIMHLSALQLHLDSCPKHQGEAASLLAREADNGMNTKERMEASSIPSLTE